MDCAENSVQGTIHGAPPNPAWSPGATVTTGRVTVPAGSYTARHVRFGDLAGGGTTQLNSYR